jgi:hypothetical protein
VNLICAALERVFFFPQAVKLCLFEAPSFSAGGEVAPKMEQEEYFRVNRERSRVDSRLAGEHAACCGVNLAFAALERVFFFPQAVKPCLFEAPSFSAGGEVAPKMEQEEYFRVNREWSRVDGRLAEDQASCCGVNLAFAALERVVFSGSWGVVLHLSCEFFRWL